MSSSIPTQIPRPPQPLIFCRRCYYVLNAASIGRCPECGTEFSLADRRTYLTTLVSRATRRWTLALACVLLLLGTFNIVAYFLAPSAGLAVVTGKLEPVPSWAILWIWLPLNSLGPVIFAVWMAWRWWRRS